MKKNALCFGYGHTKPIFFHLFQTSYTNKGEKVKDICSLNKIIDVLFC